ncbi:polysaccharide deacetylase family protein [Treponema phagedenis]|uniref:polysaccharide deacetylase family protein n=2 Tax=Treponema phagedenis TaxID=162 RepID=UPI0011EC344B|nr:polysaccharide deacetylase family protein [Treponema phagedenis]TYT79685.1 polysaccharide deacetylase family protein [Treponema phagedenis]
MKHAMRYFFLLTVFFSCCFFVSALTSFEAVDINSENNLLFSVKTDVLGQYSYSTLVQKNIESGKTELLTFFPERVDSLADGAIIQIRNRYGIVRIRTADGTIIPFESFLSMHGQALIKQGMLDSCQTSPDGRWISLIEPISPAYGRLVLYDVHKGARYILAEKIKRAVQALSWAPDSSAFILEKDLNLYFLRPQWFETTSSIETIQRKIGSGTIETIQWISSANLLAVQGNAVYKIGVSEIFARSFYTPIVQIGTLVGSLPFAFDPSRDVLSLSPDAATAVFVKDKRHVYHCSLYGDDYLVSESFQSVPYLLLSGNNADIKIYWLKGRNPIIYSAAIREGNLSIEVRKLVYKNGSVFFKTIAIPNNAQLLAVSPAGEKLAFAHTNGFFIYDVQTERIILQRDGERAVSAAWQNEDRVCIGGMQSLQSFSVSGGDSLFLLYSQVSAFSWSRSEKSVLAEVRTAAHEKPQIIRYLDNLKWERELYEALAAHKTFNAAYRVYIDYQGGFFSNMIYLRSLYSNTTAALYAGLPAYIKRRPSKPVSAPKNTPGFFTHGMRNGGKEVALVFDLVDNIEGLPEILYVLKTHSITGTFFINGEAIRRHPVAVKEIALCGHQCGSLFFTSWNIATPEYRIDEAFISQGLARNEDDFYAATGKELSLVWHTPFYVSSPMVLKAGRKSGYTFISPDVSVPDWINSQSSVAVPKLYRPAADLVELCISQTQPGSIIPIRIGRQDSGDRCDYLYEHVELLINALSEEGYTIVPLQKLMQTR